MQHTTKSRGQRYRFVFVRELTKIQDKKPVQLDIFTPYDYEHRLKFVLTNKSLNVKNLVDYQENIFAELKRHDHFWCIG